MQKRMGTPIPKAYLHARVKMLEAAVGRVEDDEKEKARLHVEGQRLTRILPVTARITCASP